MPPDMRQLFDLGGRVAIVTGGAGLLGIQHAEAIAAAGASPVLVDIRGDRAEEEAARISDAFGVSALGVATDVTSGQEVGSLLETVLSRYGRADILINNAANNPTVERTEFVNFSRLEDFPLSKWDLDIAVGLTGAFLCSQVIGTEMARAGHGVIVNVASDLALIGPDQRIYREKEVPDHLQPVKPVSYTVVKSALLGLTRYLATYWAEKGVRVNAISPGGVYTGQPDEFVARLAALIPLGRMAAVAEYQGAILFLCSDASSYMTGANLIVDGGRTAW